MEPSRGDKRQDNCAAPRQRKQDERNVVRDHKHGRAEGLRFREMLGNLTYATNRMHQVASGRIVCHQTSYPIDGSNKEECAQLANTLVTGRLPVKNQVRLSKERCDIAQNAAFSSARQLTSNSDQKMIIRDWGKEGGTNMILQTAAEVVGISAPNLPNMPESSWERMHPAQQAHVGKKKNTPCFQKPTHQKTTPPPTTTFNWGGGTLRVFRKGVKEKVNK